MYSNSSSSLLASSQRSSSPPPSPYIANLGAPGEQLGSTGRSSAPEPPIAGPSRNIPIQSRGEETADVGMERVPGIGTENVRRASYKVRTPMIQDERRRDGKADQIIQHFYAKTCAVVSQARMTHHDDSASGAPYHQDGMAMQHNSTRRSLNTQASAKRTNRWFNLELPETDLFRMELKTWKSVSTLLSMPPSPSSSTAPRYVPASDASLPLRVNTQVPPMILDIILDTCDLAQNQVLVLSDQRGRRVKVDGTSPNGGSQNATTHPSISGARSPHAPPSPRANVILERWTVHLLSSFPDSPPELPSVYKHAIILFRTLFTIVRALPTWSLHRKLSRRRIGAGGLMIGCRMRMEEAYSPEGCEVDLNQPIVEVNGEPVTETATFPSIQTPIGLLSLSCTYRLRADFGVEDIEALLSSRFIDEDFFKPTMARYHLEQQEAAMTRPGSLPITSRVVSNSGLTPPSMTTTTGPSYGSLSSKRVPSSADPQYLPNDSRTNPSTAPLSDEQLPRSLSSMPQEPQTPPESQSSSGPFGSYGGGVEPAFVSLSRTKGRSYSSSIHRAGSTGMASSPNQATSVLRRPSLQSGSPSSGSPIFRASSYVSSPPSGSSASAGPTSNINRMSSSPSSLGFGRPPILPSSSSFGSRSPLAPPLPAGSYSGLSSAAPRPIPSPSGTTPIRTYSSGSYSRSYGRGSSGGSFSAGEAPGIWTASEAQGWRPSRPSFGANSRVSGFDVLEEGVASGSSNDSKKFLPSAIDDSADINSFLGMIDSRPNLNRPQASTGSVILSRDQADETLQKLKGSMYLNTGRALPIGSDFNRAKPIRHGSRLSVDESRLGSSPSAIVRLSPGSSGDVSDSNSLAVARASASQSSSKPSHSPVGSANSMGHYATSTQPVSESSNRSQVQPMAFPLYVSRARPSGAAANVTTGFDLAHTSQTVSSTNSVGEDAGTRSDGHSGGEFASASGPTQSGYTGEEEEAVGQLELGEEDRASLELTRASKDEQQSADPRGRTYEEQSDTHVGTRSRDRTPSSAESRLQFRRGRRHFSPDSPHSAATASRAEQLLSEKAENVSED